MDKQFKLVDGRTFSGLSPEDYDLALATLINVNGLSLLQLAESAGVGGAMVLRVALGLSAAGARISAIVDESRAGYIALALLRQLTNAGSTVSIFTPAQLDQESEFGKQVFAAFQAGAVILSLTDTTTIELKSEISQSHAFIFGTFGSSFADSELHKEVCGELNEMQTPVHAIEFPPGVSKETGEAVANPIFAATTIIPGLPLASLASASDFAGRLYVCDVSVPKSSYDLLIPELGDIFVQQPVNQIFLNQVVEAE